IQRDAKSNAVSLVDDRGAVVFAAGTPLMWDSTEVSSAALGATAQSQSASGTTAESVPERLSNFLCKQGDFVSLL
ncbi:MAG: hypothetical protein ACREJ4_13880, partial [Candidatus Methylomirabilaceae bacterium]